MTTTTCAVPGCVRPVHAARFGGTLCASHSDHKARFGSPTERCLHRGVLKRYREEIARVLAKYGHTPAVAAALNTCADLLLYQPSSDFTSHHATAAQFARLRDGAVTPRDLLQRAVEVFAVHKFDGQWTTPAVLDSTLARFTMQLRPSYGVWRPRQPLLRYMGGLIRENLALFPYAVLARVERDRNIKATAKELYSKPEAWKLAGE